MMVICHINGWHQYILKMNLMQSIKSALLMLSTIFLSIQYYDFKSKPIIKPKDGTAIDCWTGLIIQYDKEIISYLWFDGSTVDYIPSFCDGYPLFFENNTISYTYVNVSALCWANTDHLVKDRMICGPSTKQPLLCWTSRQITPAIMCFLLFFLSTYLLYKTWRY